MRTPYRAGMNGDGQASPKSQTNDYALAAGFLVLAVLNAAVAVPRTDGLDRLIVAATALMLLLLALKSLRRARPRE
jgi:hypothetical protein